MIYIYVYGFTWIYIYTWLVVSPPKHISQLGLLFPYGYGKFVKNMFQPTNQIPSCEHSMWTLPTRSGVTISWNGRGAPPGPWTGGSPIRWKPWDGRRSTHIRHYGEKKPEFLWIKKKSGNIWEILFFTILTYGKRMNMDENGPCMDDLLYTYIYIYILLLYIYPPQMCDFLWLCWISIREFFSKLHGMISYREEERNPSPSMAAMGVLSENPVLQQ